jgi:NTP pyrophosphatase (non-canonical NTP hydrolase)
MNVSDYQRLAMRTEADQSSILSRLVLLGENTMRLDNAARGLCSDAGEVADVVLKHIEYRQPLDKIHLLEEVGDVLWRVAQLCKAAGFTMEEAMASNIRKLQVRYPNFYTDQSASHRNREAEAKAVEGSTQHIVSVGESVGSAEGTTEPVLTRRQQFVEEYLRVYNALDGCFCNDFHSGNYGRSECGKCATNRMILTELKTKIEPRPVALFIQRDHVWVGASSKSPCLRCRKIVDQCQDGTRCTGPAQQRFVETVLDDDDPKPGNCATGGEEYGIMEGSSPGEFGGKTGQWDDPNIPPADRSGS